MSGFGKIVAGYIFNDEMKEKMASGNIIVPSVIDSPILGIITSFMIFSLNQIIYLKLSCFFMITKKFFHFNIITFLLSDHCSTIFF